MYLFFVLRYSSVGCIKLLYLLGLIPWTLSSVLPSVLWQSLKSILCYMKIIAPTFFWFPFAWDIFFQPLTFSLYVSLGLRWVSCGCIFRGLFFFFLYPFRQSVSLIGAFSHLLLRKLLIHMILLSFTLLFCIWLCRPFLSLMFPV